MFDHFHHKEKNDQLSDKNPTQKLLILLLLLGGQKHCILFTVDGMTVTKGLHFNLIMFLNIQNQKSSWTASTKGLITEKLYVL